jgi:branched-chain amino acid transport system ATP-binding protein
VTALLEVAGVHKAFGSLLAVDDVSFSVRPGEILGIAGPNGAGKTTLFNLISGVPFSADRGVVMFDGVRIEAMRPDRIFQLGLARTFQREASFRKLTVEQNVALGVRYSERLKAAERNDAVEQALVEVDLASRRHALAESLTVYETKRLMLASAVAGRPKLLMLDEPASGLTTEELADIQRHILRLRHSGIAIILIEHILPLLFGISGRVMVMDFGRKLTEGPPSVIARDERVIEAYLGGRKELAIDALGG